MSLDEPDMYEKLKVNFQREYGQRPMAPIQDDGEESYLEQNSKNMGHYNSVRTSRRGSIPSGKDYHYSLMY